MSTLSLTIDQSSLSLADLVIGSFPPAEGLWVESIDLPGFSYRYTYAPDSAWVAGKTLLAAVLDQSTLPLTVHGTSATAAGLVTLRNSLVTALGQFAFDVTLTVDGGSTTWAADPSYPGFGNLSGPAQAALTFAAVLTIPVNPAGSS